ncbi:type II secretion system minor pseudopilin GspI, partial [Vibrio rotiferianus]
FASLSVAAYQVVSQVQRSDVLSQEKIQRLNELQRAMVMMDNDFRQMANVMLDSSALKAKKGTEELAGRTWYWKVTPVATTQPLLKAFDVSVAVEKNASPIVTVRSYVDK